MSRRRQNKVNRCLRFEKLEDRRLLVVGAIDLPFATDPAAVVNGGDNLGGVIDLNDNCTGSLHDRGANVDGSRHVLTAAHCVISAEEQRLAIAGNGSFDLTFNGATTNILTTDTAAQIQTRLQALGTIGNGNVNVRAGATAFRVFFVNALNGQNVPQMTVSNFVGTASATVTTADDGFNDTGSTQVVEFFLPTATVNNPRREFEIHPYRWNG